MAQGAQTGCGVSILRDIQKLSEHDSEQLTVGVSAGAQTRQSPAVPSNLNLSDSLIARF